MKLSDVVVSYTARSIITDMKNDPIKTIIIALSAIPAFELFVRSIGNLHNMVTSKQNPALQSRTVETLLGAALLTSCAFEVFPGARLCGAIGFIFYSLHRENHRHTFISSDIVHGSYTKVLRPGILGLTNLFLRTIDYIGRNPIKTALILASG